MENKLFFLLILISLAGFVFALSSLPAGVPLVDNNLPISNNVDNNSNNNQINPGEQTLDENYVITPIVPVQDDSNQITLQNNSSDNTILVAGIILLLIILGIFFFVMKRKK